MDPQDKFYLHNRLTDAATRAQRAKMPHPLRTQRVLALRGLKIQIQPARPVLVTRQQILEHHQELAAMEAWGALGCKHPTSQIWVSIKDKLPDTAAVGVVEYRLQDPEPPPLRPGAIFAPDGSTGSFVPPQGWERRHPTEQAEALEKAMQEGILTRAPNPAPSDEGVEDEEMPEIEDRTGPPPQIAPETDPIEKEIEETEPLALPPPRLEVRPPIVEIEDTDDPFNPAPQPPLASVQKPLGPAPKWQKRGRNR